MTSKQFVVTAKSRTVHQVEMRESDKAGWHQDFLLCSDRHIDSNDSNKGMQRKHLDEAVSRGAGIIEVGDTFDAMQGRNDPRRMKGQGGGAAFVANYLDRIVNDASVFLAPYAGNYVVMARGNHEQSILKNCETDLIERTCERMSMMSGHRVHAGGYGGWVRFVARWSTRGCLGLNLKYYHGSGGGGMMSHGTLQTRRIASWTPDADVIVSGHTHDQWTLTLSRERLGHGGKVYLDEQHHVRCPSYKDEYVDGHSGWHIERGMPPKPIGAWWMRLHWVKVCERLGVEFARAA